MAVVEAQYAGEEIAGPGMSSGNPHQIPEDIHEAVEQNTHRRSKSRFANINPIPVVGDGLQKLQKGIFDGVTSGFDKIRGGVEDVLPKPAYGYQPEDAEDHYRAPAGQRRPSLNERGSSRSAKRGSTLLGREEVDDNEGPSRRRNTLKGEEGTSTTRTPLPLSTQEEVDEPSKLAFWKRSHAIHGEEDETPLSSASPTTPRASTVDEKADVFQKSRKEGKKGKKEKQKTEYSKAYNEEESDDKLGEPVWKKYLTDKDRETMRLPIFGLTWMPSLPLIGKKVDTIYYCRKEVARLNVEIEKDQSEPEKYPLMNSAFIQFNHQVAAHMACQSLSHHVPQQMCPRHIEVSPNDVIWDNMKINWWQRYMRIFGITVAVSGLIIGWAFPVAVVGLLSQIDYLTEVVTWLAWINDLPNPVVGLIQGILPPLGLAILMALLPIILRCKLPGPRTAISVWLIFQHSVCKASGSSYRHGYRKGCSRDVLCLLVHPDLPRRQYFLGYYCRFGGSSQQSNFCSFHSCAEPTKGFKLLFLLYAPTGIHCQRRSNSPNRYTGHSVYIEPYSRYYR